jgi:glycosyltransferase involved in cell wall biosynthesis
LISFRRLYPRWLFPGKTEFDPSRRPAEFPTERILSPLNPLRWLAAMRAIACFSPDLVIIAWWHSWFFPCTVFCLAWLRWIQRRRTVLLCHNIGSHDHRVADSVAWPVLSRLPHAHIVHQSDGPKRIRALNPKAQVICSPHPVYEFFCDAAVTREEARRRLSLNPGDEVCLVFGLVRRYKGVDIAIEAARLLQDRPRFRLLVAGEFYEPRDPYDRMIQRLGLAGRVILEDRYIPNEEVALYYRAADVLVAPYREASHSGVVQIAVGFGLPVIASDVGGMKDLVSDGKTGLLVPAVDAKALADAVRRFFDQGLAVVFRQNIEKQKGRFSWSSLAEKILNMVQ